MGARICPELLMHWLAFLCKSPDPSGLIGESVNSHADTDVTQNPVWCALLVVPNNPPPEMGRISAGRDD